MQSGQSLKNFGRAAIRITVAGTVSRATGGKFANGAAYAAFMIAIKAGVNAYRDSVTDKFIENNVKHFDSMDTDAEETALPEETRKALYRIGRTNSGHRAFNTVIESGNSVNLYRYMDQGFNSFMTWDYEDGANDIIYTTDVQKWIEGNIQHAIPQRQLESSTLGSLLGHEFGHTSFGGSLEEIQATSIFENDYRRTYGMPLVDGYDKSAPSGVCLYEERC
ncbi:hypothetical protein [Microbulbifer thermotolerans]|uniref:hypothetical protein n=1 Tax=Microbulbifer thermotolerans TaxID=252514 RepID=UPI002248BC49|nr:hypothetical protein [Microbulbifer thermotolerans]MCX2781324.1 hypothetical protein [Microbulbifer thermotolerans]MCX2803571.1 hypothetical protein [Microbulbifer thermotolerans]MCX2829955.1 hypothetical protein [Microbulbifer thermotolerans]MCX2841424.1 hypothetical protein [Microbulbifer thermotolerans]WKT61478.1 hypothetical protein Q2E61_04620 [Microbulbifer thermotolerans]